MATTTSTKTTTTLTGAMPLRLNMEHLGLARTANIPLGSIEFVNKMLNRNHDEHHIFWRDLNGHNHVAHNLLTNLSLGATPSELMDGFNVNLPSQRLPPKLDRETVNKISNDDEFFKRIGVMDEYTNFLCYFEEQIDQKGWPEVVNKYLFSRSPSAEQLLYRLCDGAYHPIIHIGLGIEYQLPGIIAEGLAQCASHVSNGVHLFYPLAEEKALKQERPSKPLVELFEAARANATVRNSVKYTDAGNKMRDGVFVRAMPEITDLAGQFRIKPEELERRTAEVLSCCAYLSAAGQRGAKQSKIDFFYMHNVTSTIFLTVMIRQPWIKLEDRVRLVEYKARLDIAWYPTCGTPVLDVNNITHYDGGNRDFESIYRGVCEMPDDGHVAKFVRAIRNGYEVSKPFEQGEGSEDFPVKGNDWLQIARMAYNSTVGRIPEDKWVVFTGFPEAWVNVPNGS